MAKPEQLERLTDKQKEVLRLVLHRNGSKDIARELGISPHTVDARLRAAIGILDVTSRFEAARALAAREGGYQPLTYQTPELPGTVSFDDPEGLSTNVVREERATFELANLDGVPANDTAKPKLINQLMAQVGLLAAGSGVLVIAMLVVSTIVRAISTGRPITIHL